jgi:hypothetical protein
MVNIAQTSNSNPIVTEVVGCMERIGPGYAAEVTPLTHEKAYVASRIEDEQMTPPDNGGWDVEARAFETVRNYRQLNTYDYDDKQFLFIPLWRLFLDAYTAAVENGYLDQANWKKAFRFTDGWLAIGTDLMNSAPVWLNERHRTAVAATIFYGALSGATFSTYRELGEFLVKRVDWDTPTQRLRLL